MEMRTGLWRMMRSRRGASVAEMALLMPLLLLLAVGVADLGRAFHSYIVITNSSREGARYASHLPAYESGIKQAALNETIDSGLKPALTLDDITVDGLNSDRGQPIAVEVTYSLPTIMGSLIGMPNLTLRSRTEMVVFGLEPTPTPGH